MSNNLPLSVAIATCNIEGFIGDCIASILRQTFTDFELLCIDDGSVDNTVQVIQHYAAKDKRIRLIANPTNHGLSVIRDQSLKEAKGKYLLLLDGDDLYDSSYFEKAIRLAEEEQSDMVMCDYLPFYKESEINRLQKQPSLLKQIDKCDKIGLLRRPAFAGVKLIKTQTARELEIHFPTGYTRQDIPVHWRLITALDKISLLPEKMVFYRQQSSATTAQMDEKLLHFVYVIDIVKTEVLQNRSGLWEKYYKEFYRQQLNAMFGMYDNIQISLKNKALSLIKERLSPEHYRLIKQGLPIRKPAKWFYLQMKEDNWARLRLHLWKMGRSIYRQLK